MLKLKPLVVGARALLALPVPNGTLDVWLWEHSLRVTRLARLLAALPEVGGERPSDEVLTVAALYHEAGWAVQVLDGEIERARVLSRPTSDLQRDLASVALGERASELVDAQTLRLAGETIRQCNRRDSELPEARVLSDATNLDDIGVLYMSRQIRQCHAEGRSIEDLLRNWERLRQYDYWEARINDCLRFETARAIARSRLEAVGPFLAALARDCTATDLLGLLGQSGISPPDELPLV